MVVVGCVLFTAGCETEQPGRLGLSTRATDTMLKIRHCNGGDVTTIQIVPSGLAVLNEELGRPSAVWRIVAESPTPITELVLGEEVDGFRTDVVLDRSIAELEDFEVHVFFGENGDAITIPGNIEIAVGEVLESDGGRVSDREFFSCDG
jgi:hypothetical protein